MIVYSLGWLNTIDFGYCPNFDRYVNMDDATLNEYTQNCLGISFWWIFAEYVVCVAMIWRKWMNEWNWNANKVTSSRECETIVTDIYNIQMWLAHEETNPYHISEEHELSNPCIFFNVLEFFFGSIFEMINYDYDWRLIQLTAIRSRVNWSAVVNSNDKYAKIHTNLKIIIKISN